MKFTFSLFDFYYRILYDNQMTPTNEDRYRMTRFLLCFNDTGTESLYRKHILKKTLHFCQIAWILVILLGGSFAFLDRRIFGDDSGTVTILRILIILVSLLIIGSTLRKKTEKFHDWNAFIFILMIGMFCIYLISLSDSAIFTPYFTGLFFAFTGVFTIPGLGFRYSFFALLINVILFELYFGLFNPMPSLNFLVYNFFLLGMVFIFVYLGYLIEGVSRRNFVTAARLQDSLDEVKTLSGLLPICSQCKNIRDDKGYWQQVETYIRHHSDAEFTHGICPDCAKNLYSDQVWYQQMPQSARDKILKQ